MMKGALLNQFVVSETAPPTVRFDNKSSGIKFFCVNR